MSNLILDSLEIRNFRGIKELRIEKLGRVNLIVGKNNVGKTSVLEALRLFSRPGSMQVIRDLLISRDHFDADNLYSRKKSQRPFPIRQLFRTQNAPTGEITSIPIDIKSTGTLPSSLKVILKSDEAAKPFPTHELAFVTDQATYSIELRHLWDLVQTLDDQGPSLLRSPISSAPSIFVSANLLDASQVGALWDEIALTPMEGSVLDAMRVISPDLERLILRPIEGPSDTRVPFVKLKNLDSPVTLRSLGDGVYRVFLINLALVNAKGGILLIDEIENGLHYSVQPEIWKLIFNTVARLNIQLFATTHSYDCIRAFEQAAKESDTEGIVIRLALKGGKLLVAEFDEEELAVAVDGQIKVR